MSTINEILDRFQRDYVPNLAPRTQMDYARHIRDLRRVFGTRNPDEMKPRDFGEFLNVPKGKIQRNKQLAVLSCAISEAVGRWYMCDRNVLKDVKRNPFRHRDRYITDAEFAAVRALAKPAVQVAMDLALLTGQRQGDLLQLTWDRVTPVGIRFCQGKTGKRLIVTRSPELDAVLARAMTLPINGPNIYVVRARRGGAFTGEAFRAQWQRNMRKALRLGAVATRFTFHDIRGKSASDSGSVEDAYERLGHQDISITRQIYDRAERPVKPLR